MKPVSAYDHDAYPNALLLVVFVAERSSDTRATVDITRFRYGVGVSEGFTATTEWKNGFWKIVRSDHHWST